MMTAENDKPKPEPKPEPEPWTGPDKPPQNPWKESEKPMEVAINSNNLTIREGDKFVLVALHDGRPVCITWAGEDDSFVNLWSGDWMTAGVIGKMPEEELAMLRASVDSVLSGLRFLLLAPVADGCPAAASAEHDGQSGMSPIG